MLCSAHLPLSFPQLLSLTLDGLTGVSQDHMRAHYQTGSNHMMLNVNLWSTLFLGAGEERPHKAQPRTPRVLWDTPWDGPMRPAPEKA